ncbi:diguanylate cyclase, partial [Striga asiatica]
PKVRRWLNSEATKLVKTLQYVLFSHQTPDQISFSVQKTFLFHLTFLFLNPTTNSPLAILGILHRTSGKQSVGVPSTVFLLENEKLEGKTTPEVLPRISHKIAVDDAREEEKFNSSTDEETKIWNLRHWEPIEASPSENCLTSDTLRQYDRMPLTDLLNSKVMVRREEERTSSFQAQVLPSIIGLLRIVSQCAPHFVD